MASQPRWYQLPVEEVLSGMGTGESGLTSVEAKRRLAKYGHNELVFRRQGAFVRLLRQFNNPLIYVLLAAAALTGFLGMWVDTSVILLVVMVNAIIGFIQEGKAEASMEGLKRMMVPQCAVLRDGERRDIPARELVPGDVVILEEGDRIPADLRLFYARNLDADEAALTGDREMVQLAVLHDPLTAAVCDPDETWRMCDEMFEALAPWLPQFNGDGRRWADLPQPNDGKLCISRSAGAWRPPTLAG